MILPYFFLTRFGFEVHGICVGWTNFFYSISIMYQFKVEMERGEWWCIGIMIRGSSPVWIQWVNATKFLPRIENAEGKVANKIKNTLDVIWRLDF